MDQLIRAIDKNFSFRLFFVRTDEVVQQAKEFHALSPIATKALGRLLTANLLLAADLKSKDDRLTLQIRGNGPAGYFISTADGDGHVKGYVENPQEGMLLDKVPAYVGEEGTFVLIRDYGLKEPYTAMSPLISGEIAQDIVAYYYQTERIPTALATDVLLDEEGNVKRAGGFFLQAMPGVSEEELAKIEEGIKNSPDVMDMLEADDFTTLLDEHFKEFEMEILNEEEVSYLCDCSKEKVRDALMSLNVEEMIAMKEEDHGAEVVCHFCNKKYTFTEQDLTEMIEQKS